DEPTEKVAVTIDARRTGRRRVLVHAEQAWRHRQEARRARMPLTRRTSPSTGAVNAAGVASFSQAVSSGDMGASIMAAGTGTATNARRAGGIATGGGRVTIGTAAAPPATAATTAARTSLLIDSDNPPTQRPA